MLCSLNVCLPPDPAKIEKRSLKSIRWIAFFFHSADAFIEQQVWKTQIDLNIFQEMMGECDEFEAANCKTRYIKFKHDSSVGESAESEQGEAEEATGGETAADENAAEQIFFETTV